MTANGTTNRVIVVARAMLHKLGQEYWVKPFLEGGLAEKLCM